MPLQLSVTLSVLVDEGRPVVDEIRLTFFNTHQTRHCLTPRTTYPERFRSQRVEAKANYADASLCKVNVVAN